MNFQSKYILNSLFKRSGMWILTKVIHSGAIFFIFYIYAFFLEKEEYGNYQKAFVVVGFLSGLLSFGLSSFIPALPLDTLDNAIQSIFKKAGIFFLLALIVITTSIYFVLPELSLLVKVLLIVLGLLTSLNLIYEVYGLKQRHDKFIFRINLAFSVLYLIIHAVVLTQYSLVFLLLFLTLLSLSRFFISYFNIGRLKFFSFGNSNHNSVKGFYSQWFLTALNETLELVSKYIDKIVLIGLLTANEFAVYFNGSYEIPLLGLLVAAAGMFINLQTIENNLSNQGIKNVFHVETLFFASIVFPIFFFASLYAYPLFGWLFNNKYNDAVGFFLIYAWVIPVRVANYTAILQQRKRVSLITIGSVSALLVKLALMFLLYPFWQTKGVALACVIGTFYQNIFYLYHTAKTLDVPFYSIFPFTNLLIIFIISLTVNLSCYLYFRNLDVKLQVVFGCIIAALSGIFILLLYSKKQISILNVKTSASLS
jgi:O-antigen/teichoic acid export membrane protein